MRVPYPLVVFDWEGTLGDPLGHIHDALKIMAARLGLGEYDAANGSQYVSIGLEKAVKKIFPDLTLQVYEQLLMGVQQELVHNTTPVYIFPGAKEVIRALRAEGVTLAIATNKGQQSLERDLQSSGLDAYFSITASASQYSAKPSPEMLDAILEQSGCNAQDCLMIGDTTSDMEMSEAVHMPCIGVDFYHQQADDLKAAGAKEVFHDFVQVKSYLGLS